VRELAILILAAGKGTRMPADRPKVLQPVAGEPLLAHVLRTARALGPQRILLVLGHRAEEVRAAVGSDGLEIVLQPDPRGTGEAVRLAEPLLRGFEGDVLVLYGDVPLVRPATLGELLERHALEQNAATLLSATLDDPAGYGRIVRDERGFVCGIVEQRELRPDQERIREIHSGIAVFRGHPLLAALARIRPQNRTGEYYLTDVFGLLHQTGERIGACHLRDPDEILGVNTPDQLRWAEQVHARRATQAAGCELCRLSEWSRSPAGGPDAEAAYLLGAGERICLRVSPRPFNSGHLVLFPRRHVTHATALTPEELRELGSWLQRAEGLLVRVYGCEALNVGCSSGVGEHLGVQLVPRWPGDLNFLPLVADLKLIPETPLRSWQRLREAMR